MNETSSSSSKVNMSLDEIIRMDRIRAPRKFSDNNNNNRQNGFRNRNNYRRNQRFNKDKSMNYRSFNNGRYNNYNNNRSRFDYQQQQQQNNRNINRQYQSAKLFVSNLASTVNTEDLNELFMSYGNLNHAFLHHDQYGVNLGTGEIEFERLEEAIAAKNKLNGVPLDGKPLNIILLDSRNQDDQILRFKSSISKRSNDNNNNNNNYNNRQRFNNNNNYNNNRNTVSAEDLDRELDEWRMKSAMQNQNDNNNDNDDNDIEMI